MIQTKFSPLCIHVTYKLNKFRVETTPDGLRVGDVIRLACAKLGIPASQHGQMALIRNQVLLDRTLVLFPFSRVVLCESKHPTDPPLKRSLWQMTRQSEGRRSKDTLKMLAIEVFQEMVYEMQLLAHYGQHLGCFEFPMEISATSLIRTPPTWIRSIMADDNIRLECDKILDMLKDELKKHDLFPIIDGMFWTISWKPNAEEEFVTLLTARDLNVMGYSMNDKTLYMKIHKELRNAISLGEVSEVSLEAQKAWVRRHFSP